MKFTITTVLGLLILAHGGAAQAKLNVVTTTTDLKMLVAEKKRYQRVLGDIPVHDLQAGNAEGQVPLRKLTSTIMKLPRTLTGPQMTELDHRLKALAVTQGTLPIPKGPLPKGVKMPKGAG